jgi:hypothetical protein
VLVSREIGAFFSRGREAGKAVGREEVEERRGSQWTLLVVGFAWKQYGRQP